MDTVSNSSNRALIVHRDETDVALNNESAAAHPANEIVLDALPYVEPLDPNYENYAIQLIEEELQHESTGVSGEHPSLQTLLAPVSSSRKGTSAETINFGTTDLSSQCPQFGGKAPMAVAAYEAIMAKKSNPENTTFITTNKQWLHNRSDPMAHQKFDQVDDKSKLITNLHTSISTQKIALEHQRHRLINLELQQTFQTPQTYTHYNTNQLEGQIVNPLQQTVERQRMEVDAINATRMEEQQRAMGTLDGLSRKYYELVDKNLRLGEAVKGLEGEVEGLKKESGASVVVDDN
eukprot:scaffold7021_cov120-Skeletonema_dohrnii-CCMP3373.AAC.2